ncbi:MAG: hypothetical protein Q9175_001722 [Cornicularia normoerica]
MRPLFTVVSSAPASTATGVTNVTADELPNQKHTTDCEHNHNAKHNITSHHAHNSTTESKDHVTKGKDHAAKLLGNPSPYPGFNASAYAPPHAVQAHNHTGDYCNHPSQHNTTTTGATSDKIIHLRKFNANVDSLHNNTRGHCAHLPHYNGTKTHYELKHDGACNHTGYSCTRLSHHNGATTAGHGRDKKSVIPRFDVKVCLGADCKNSKVVTANVNSAGELTGVDTKNSKRMVKRQDTEISYEDVARQMSGGEIAGGV